MQYPQEVKTFILDNAAGISTAELTRMLNETFDSSYTTDQIRYYKKNHKIRSGKPGGSVSKLFPDEIRDFISRESEGKLAEELTAAVNEAFGSSYTVGQIRSYKKNHKISSGIDCRFKKGHPSDRKGKHFYAAGSEKGQFKKRKCPTQLRTCRNRDYNGRWVPQNEGGGSRRLGVHTPDHIRRKLRTVTR